MANGAVKKPNIVLIVAETLGYECLGTYGSVSYETPHLDSLAKDGLRFNHYYSLPLPDPSRLQVLTGQYIFRHAGSAKQLNKSELTVAGMLKDAGYMTAVAGNWFPNGKGIGGATPDNSGFQEHCVWLRADQASDKQLADLGREFSGGSEERTSYYYHPLIKKNGTLMKTSDTDYGPDIYSDFICDFVSRNKDKPFFVYYSMVVPAFPFHLTPDARKTTSKKLKKAGKQDTGRFKEMISYMDKVVGKILTNVDEMGLRDNTIIMFASLSGTLPTVTTLMEEGRKMRGGNGLSSDAGTRGPLIVRGPSGFKTGISDSLVDTVDFLATFAEIAGVDFARNKETDSQSFYGALTGNNQSPRKWTYHHFAPFNILGRSGRYIPGKWARSRKYKLYANGNLFAVYEDEFESNPIDPDRASLYAYGARKRLQAVLDDFPGLEAAPALIAANPSGITPKKEKSCACGQREDQKVD